MGSRFELRLDHLSQPLPKVLIVSALVWSIAPLRIED